MVGIWKLFLFVVVFLVDLKFIVYLCNAKLGRASVWLKWIWFCSWFAPTLRIHNSGICCHALSSVLGVFRESIFALFFLIVKFGDFRVWKNKLRNAHCCIWQRGLNLFVYSRSRQIPTISEKVKFSLFFCIFKWGDFFCVVEGVKGLF